MDSQIELFHPFLPLLYTLKYKKSLQSYNGFTGEAVWGGKETTLRKKTRFLPVEQIIPSTPVGKRFKKSPYHGEVSVHYTTECLKLMLPNVKLPMVVH